MTLPGESHQPINAVRRRFRGIVPLTEQNACKTLDCSLDR